MPNNIIYEFSKKLKKLIDDCEEEEGRFIAKSRASAPPESNKIKDALNKDEKMYNKSDDDEDHPKAKRLRADSTPALNNDVENLFTLTPISFLNGENSSRKRKIPRSDSLKSESGEFENNDNAVGDQFTALIMAAANGNFPFLAAAAAAMNQNISTNVPLGVTAPSSTSSISSSTNNSNLLNDNSYLMCDSGGTSPQKRARTRITDEQLKILRQYFDINNSPSEEHIKEMSIKAQLPEKVIKHWFRNTLFKVIFVLIKFIIIEFIFII